MGLFKPSKSQQGPLPNVELYLAPQRETVFKPNDVISGHIVLSTPIPVMPQAVEVTLWGKSETWIRKSSSRGNGSTATTDYYHYRDHAPLFDVTFNVFPKAETLVPGQEYTFPFSFRVPEGTGFNRSQCYEQPDNAIWTVQPHHLPPTFFFGREDYPDNSKISYGVTARLVAPFLIVGKSPKIDPLSCTAPILFQPLNPNAHIQTPNRVRYSKRFTLQSSTLTGQDPASIGFRQRLHDRFSSATPMLEFELGVELPDILTSGSEFNFRATFAVVKKSDKVTHIPSVTFKVLKLELLDFTLFRAPRDWAASNTLRGLPSKCHDGTPRSSYRASEQTEVKEQKTFLNSIPPSQLVELAEVDVPGEKKQIEQAGTCEAWFSGRVPGFTPPSFRSFAITRSYRIKVKVGAEIGGKMFEMNFEGTDCPLGSVHT
ncbi:uncharacterized protein BDR25DRAFT_304100 [Lindgomyces ingoldianus]|uniref:Uncharacterized protein n=1 Tax=Lindgomyces ingoldianus TaxID=673940 RepID=A0ACB6QTD4_9PLEO|nr:uncharacterized protein BDR25DRAFT_304100 [Lindgomyces ingoldianus]KAF2470145.1 hypothetical protein BDR25DRAFT_304100 [Lindgomyces ingoldianus]